MLADAACRLALGEVGWQLYLLATAQEWVDSVLTQLLRLMASLTMN